MKNCTRCGTAADDDAPACASCGWRFPPVRQSDSAATPGHADSPLRARPDGGTLIGLGSAGICFAVLSFLVAIQSGRGGPDLFYAGGSMIGWLVLAGAMFNLGLVLLLAGLVIRAIWFLPGPDYKAAPETDVAKLSEPASVSPLTRPGDDGEAV